MISMSITGLDSTKSKLKNFVKYGQQDAAKITQDYGTRFEQLVKQNASGRPGPNVITGAYRDSIHVIERSTYSVTVGTNAPQAMRLEFGFVGTDSLGRAYAQPPYPHWTPAVDVIGPQFKEAMQAAVKRWWR